MRRSPLRGNLTVNRLYWHFTLMPSRISEKLPLMNLFKRRWLTFTDSFTVIAVERKGVIWYHESNLTPPNHYLNRCWLTVNLSIKNKLKHYADVIMTTLASQITSLTVVYSIVYSGVDQRKHQSSASLAFVRGIHRDRWIPRTKGQ